VIAALSAVMFVGLTSDARASDQEGLQLELTPYFWAPGLDGKVERGSRSAHFNQSFSDLIQNVDAAFMGLAVVSYDRFVVYADYDYVSLSDEGNLRRDLIFPAGTKVKGDGDVKIGTYAAGYRFDTFGDNWVDVMFGAQLTDLNTGLKVAGSNFSNNRSLTDTVVMLRPTFNISERWRFNPTFAYGISGDSDTTYQLSPQIEFMATDSLAFRFGYKRVYWQEEHGNRVSPGFDKFDTSLAGFMLGVGWKFPGAHKREAPPPPAPAPVARPAPPPVAAKCPDADHDGVCDADDACPNTPPGTRVGPAGCDCDYVLRTHFAFDSATLTAEDKTQLDQLANTLKNPKLHFVTGEVDGYTDSTGKPEYNLQLSKRRAQAVADYLKLKGVQFGDRFIVQGYGEERPIADNKTEEGRAQNRRVSIHRTDCGPAQ
jgi:outer membrane protein OmpA-like peptidoglycan-associated protein